MNPRHFIGRQTLEVEVGTAPRAFDLLDRMGDLNRARFLPVIEGVLDQIDQPEFLLRIDRLDVDLGEVSLDRPEEAADRLGPAMRRALAEALRASRATATPAAAARRQAVETYLLSGAPPSGGGGFEHAPAVEIAALAEAEPAAFAVLVRRHARRPAFLRRLAEQTPTAVLAGLLRRLEPENAALILAHMADVAEVHRVEPAAPLAAAPFERLLWRLTLDFVLNEAGSRFNRLSFVRSLLRGLAEAEGVDYAALLLLIRRALAMTRRARPIGQSLPALLDEIARSPPPPVESEPGPAPPDVLEAWLRSGVDRSPDGIEALLLDLADTAPGHVARIFHRPVWSAAMLRRVVETFSAPTLRRLLRLLRPADAGIMLTYMAEVGRLHRVRPVAPIPPEALDRRLWRITLRFVLQDAGTQFNRRTFVREMIGSMAQEDGVSFDAVLDAFRQALPSGAASSGSLPGVIAVLVEDRARETVPVRSAPDEYEDIAVPTARHDVLDLFRAWLSGAPAWPRDRATARRAARALLPTLAGLDDARLRSALAGAKLDEPTLAAAFALIPASDARALLRRLSAPAGPDGRCPPRPASVRAGLRALLRDRAANPSTTPARPPSPIRRTRWLALLRVGLSPRGGAVPAQAWSDALDRLLRADPAAALRLVGSARSGAARARLAGLCAPATRTRLLRALHGPAAPWAMLSAAMDDDAAGNDATARALFDAALDPAASPASPEAFQRALRRLLDGLDAASARRLRRVLLARLSGAARTAAVLACEARLGPLPPSSAPEAAALTAERLWRRLSGEADGAEPIGAEALQRLLADPPPGFAARLRRTLADVRARRRLGRTASPGALIRLLLLLAPTTAGRLVEAAELLDEAAALVGGRAGSPPWALLFEIALASAPDAPERLIRRLVAAQGAEARRQGRPAAGRTVVHAALRIARRTGRVDLARRLDALGPDLAALHDGAPRPRPDPDPPKAPRRPADAADLPSETTPVGETWEVHNAGLVLAGGFLPRWLDALGYLDRDAGGKPVLPPARAGRAVHLLQALVDGRTDAPEPSLMLNKLLCGLPLAAAAPLDIIPTPEERDACDLLLRSLLAASPTLAGTSAAGFQETFLQRRGLLTRTDEAWRLVVERKTVDILLDPAGLGAALVFHAWMGGPVHVVW